MIRDQLAGRRLFITGTTGFLATNLLERLLRTVPDCEVVLLVRPGRRSTVAQRVQREILKNNAFDRLRTELGKDGFAEMTARRITAVAGDVSRDGLGLDDEGRAALASCDVVIHSAATVSFDSPIDSAVEINLMGPTRIAHTLRDLGVTPHLVAVSTCYVAGSRRGAAPEIQVQDSPFFVDVDWKAEVAAARRFKADAEDRSRHPDRLAEFRDKARTELGPAGGPILADKTESIRQSWVKQELIDAGIARAKSLGWPDAYAYTKALGERALIENRGDVPVSIVRPSIIESALEEPFPGWIRGFRMAEPVILAYARNQISEFPGVPEGIVDVIPVDIVTAAIIAVAARGPEDEPDVVQVASGSINPLRYRQLVNNIRAWFTARPIYDAKGQPILLAEFGFPGRGRVDRQLKRAKTFLDTSEKVLHSLPLRGRQAEWSAKLDEKRDEYERVKGYIQLYGKYAECEAIYGIERLLALQDAYDDEDRRDFNLDPRAVDWDRYIAEVHLPSIVEHARVRMTPGGKHGEAREDRLRRQVLSPDRQLAAFDLENTIIASNVVASYSWLATRRLPPDDRLRFIVKAMKEGPSWLAQDRADRTDFLRMFYRNYDKANALQIEEDAVEMFSQLILAKSFPAAVRRVREHRRLGHRTVLITGALEFVVKPLLPLFDDVIATGMSVRADGTYTGELTGVPPTGETRASVLFEYADQHGFDLAESVAYADSSSDLPMLEIVGFPVAVNPEVRLASLARKRGWLIEDFAKSDGADRKPLPIGSMRRRFGGGLANPLIPGRTA